MKKYYEHENKKAIIGADGRYIPVGNRIYREALAEVEAGEAEIIPYTVDIEAERLKRRAFINAQRDVVIDSGVEYNGNMFDSDKNSRANLAAVYTGINNSYTLPDGFEWVSSDNTRVPFIDADINGLSHAMLNHTNYQYQKSWLLKEAINAAGTVDEINAIDWDTVL